MTEIYQDPAKLHDALKSAGLPVVGVASTGRVDYARALTKTEIEASKALISSFDPAPSVEEARLKAYQGKGITTEKLAWALWEHIINSNPEPYLALQNVMDDVNALIH